MTTVIKPLGTAMFVKEIQSEIDLVERGRRSGLTVVVEDANRPQRATFGEVIALGTDPELHQLVREGDIVHFTPHAGYHTFVEGVRYRVVYLSDLTAVEQRSHLQENAETAPTDSQSQLPRQSPN